MTSSSQDPLSLVRLLVRLELEIEWTAASRRSDVEVDRRRCNALARRVLKETLAVAPPRFATLQTRWQNGAPRICQVALSFTDDAEIAELNGHYRRKPRPTDVLSFAQSEGEEFPMPQDAAWPLGDIVLSIETARRQAQERAHSLETELSFLLVHGTLHLLGYDHVTDAQRRVMWKWQDAIIAQLDARAKPNTRSQNTRSKKALPQSTVVAKRRGAVR